VDRSVLLVGGLRPAVGLVDGVPTLHEEADGSCPY
jgi:hypothetical protein